MRTQKIIIRKRNTLIPTKLIVDFLPSVIYLLTEGRLVLLVKYLIIIKRGQIDQSVFQQFKIRQLLTTIVHGLESYKHIVIIVDFMEIKHQALGELLVQSIYCLKSAFSGLLI